MPSGDDGLRQRDDLERKPEIGSAAIRVAGNETTARGINEAIEDGRVTAEGSIGFICECGVLGCSAVVELTVDEYEDVRRAPRQFLVANGHESESEAVVAAVDGRYTVIEKRGDDAVLAQRTDPRAEGPAVHFLWSRGRRISALSIEVEAAPDSAREVRTWLLNLAADHGADDDLRGRIAIAVTEAMTNAVRHAYPPDVRGRIEVTADVEEGELEVVVADEGAGFQPGFDGGLGAGLGLIANAADRFAIRERSPRGIELWMRFVLTSGSSEAPR